MKSVKDILNQAIANGACEKSSGASDWKSLAWLFFTPQGMEFCERTNTPLLSEFRQMDNSIIDYGVFVDRGDICRTNDANIALIGETRANLIYDDNTKVHKVILMHGAKAFIVARNYAVVRLVNIDDCDVHISRDKTAVILK